jgi:hypothetical protein
MGIVLVGSSLSFSANFWRLSKSIFQDSKMDFLMNAAKIAQDVKGDGKKKEGGESGGFGDMLGGFMGGGDKQKPKPGRDDGEYDEERPHGSRYDDDEAPHKSQSGSAGHKKPSTGELFSSAQVLYQAASGGKVDQGKLAGAASDLLDGLSMYGGEKSPYSAYAQQASSYLDGYGNKHDAPGAHGSAKPHSGRGQPSGEDEDYHPSKPRPSKYDDEESESRPTKPRPSRYDDEDSESRPAKPRPSQYDNEDSESRPAKPRPSHYDDEDSESRPAKPRPSQYDDGDSESRPSRPRPSKYESEESEYGGRPSQREEEHGGNRRPQKSQYGDEGYGSRTDNNQEEESEKPKKSWYD